MKIELPTLDLRRDPAAIATNRAVIREASQAYRAALKALEGFAKANHGLCDHPNQYAVHDPGYGGGGFSHYACDQCGMGTSG